MHPYRIEIPQAAVDDLHQRLSHTRWPVEQPVYGWDRGVPVDYLRSLAQYWRTNYDWRAAEAALNQFPQFTTEIDGTSIHFMHVRSAEADARPMVLTHGWPGSIVEFIDVIGPLSDPRSYGGDPADAFHLVIPSLPGFGFSGPVQEPGWGIERIACAWAELMRRLNYDRYIAQGGDLGSFVSLEVARTDPTNVAGVHVNMLLPTPPVDSAALAAMRPTDQARMARLGRFESELAPYLKLLSTRPQTVSYGLTDSPVGQLAWIVEKFREWSAANEVPEDAVDRDRMLTNVSIYWFTATAASSSALYYEAAEYMRALFTPGYRPPAIDVPIGVAVFPDDVALPIRELAERDHPTITRWSEFQRGGHFAAMEQPELLVGDLRCFSRSL